MWQIGTMSKAEKDILIKAGYDVRDIDEKAFNILLDINWKSKNFKSDIDKDDVLACVYVDCNVYDGLKEAITWEKSKKEMQEKAQLEHKRRTIADSLFEKADAKELEIPEDSEVVDHEGWEGNGEDSLIKKFYYTAPNGDDDSLIGSFIVDFKKNSKIAIDFHSNT